MSLQNPSANTAFIFLILLCVTGLPAAAQTTQTVKGRITDKSSEKPVINSSVTIPGTNIGTRTDSLGQFILRNVPLGRQKIAVSSVGYKAVLVPEVLVTAGKEVIADITIEEQINELKGVEVTAFRTRKGVAANEYAGTSSRSFSMDEVTRYAGGRNDPARLASNFAGVATTDDSRNDIVVRGNSPSAVLWRLEGIPIPNPNHFSNLGTTGGPVSAINTNALKNSDFYTSAFPAEYGNALGAVFDLGLRTGNKDKFETLVQLNMFSGLEAMIEGPLGKKKNGSSFLLGYRYSFAQIGQSLGFNIGTDAVPRYQDLVFNISFAPGKFGKLSIFGMGGASNIDLIGAEIDTTDLFANKNEDVYFNSRFAVAGIKHTLDLSSRSYWRTIISYSHTRFLGEGFKYYDSLPERRFESEQDTRNNAFRINSFINSKVNARLNLRAGVLAEWQQLNTFLRNRERKPDWVVYRDFDKMNLLLQPYIQAKYRFSDKLSMNAGLHGMYYDLNNTTAIEPRFNLNYAFTERQTLSFGYGLHSQQQPSPIYFYQPQNPDGSYDISNIDLDFTRAHHFVAGYEWRFLPDWRVKAEVYYQSIFDAPVERMPSGFSVLNAGADFIFPEKGYLYNGGKASNRGVEITLEKFFSKGIYLLGTASIFDAKYKGSDGVERNSTFNNKGVFNLLAGKEFKIGRTKRNTFSIDIKMTSSGGRYYTPVDLDASIEAETEKLDESNYNTLRLPSYFRLDTRFGIQLNSRKRKVSHHFYLDLQNVTNNENVFVQRYNVVRKEVGTVYQIGFFPDILYRLQF
jgi:hypothetical protein